MPSQSTLTTASCIEQLALGIKDAKPFFKQSPLSRQWKDCERNSFPAAPGIYVIGRKVSTDGQGYRFAGLVPQRPLILYVGRTSTRRTIQERLRDHFGNQAPNFQGSQFVKSLMQVVQNEEIVKDIIWSPNTVIACVAVPEREEVIDAVERLAMQVFNPRFNIKDR